MFVVQNFVKKSLGFLEDIFEIFLQKTQDLGWN